MAALYLKYEIFLAGLEHKASVAFGKLGRVCATSPWKTIGGMVLAAFVFMAGAAVMPANDNPDIWTDPNCPAQMNIDWSSELYPAIAASSTMLITAKDGGSVLRKDVFDELFAIKAETEALASSDGECTYSAVCVRNPLGQCVVQGGPAFFDNNATLYNLSVVNDASVLAAVRQTQWPGLGGTIDHADFLGTIELDSSGLPTSAKAMKVKFLNVGDCVRAWEIAWLDLFMGDQRQSVTRVFDHIEVQVSTGRSGTDELDRNVGGDIKLFAMSFLFLIVGSTVALGKPYRMVERRVGLALADLGIILLGLGAGYGFSFACQYPFSLLAQILPFILIGIGIDDAFVISGAFDGTSPDMDIPDRMQLAMERVGMSVSMTSLTDIIAFSLGCTSKLPAVQFFCFMGAASIFFIWLFHLTGFVAALALDARRQKRRKFDCICCVTSAASVAPEDGAGTPATASAKELGYIRQCMRALAKCLVANIAMKAFVMVSFLGVFALSAWAAATQTQSGFDLLYITPDVSYLRASYLSEETYFGFRTIDDNPPALIYFKQADVSTAKVQADMTAVAEDILDLPTIETNKAVVNWLAAWRHHASVMKNVSGSIESNLVVENACSTRGTACGDYFTGPQVFPSIAAWVQASPTVVPGAGMLLGGQRFHSDVFDQGKTSIVSSRMFAYHTNLKGSLIQMQALDEVEAFYKDRSSDIEFVIVGARYALWDQYRIIIMEIVVTFLLAVVAVLIISTFVIIHPVSVLLVSIVLAMIFVELLAAVSMWGLEVNSLTGICLICSVGIVVDYTAHICHCFSIQDPSLSRDQRVIETMTQMGAPVATGVMTTAIAIVPLGFASSESFRVFFRMFMSMVVVGGLNGLLFVPVTLSFIGPALQYRKDHLVAAAPAKFVVKELEQSEGPKEGTVQDENPADAKATSVEA